MNKNSKIVFDILNILDVPDEMRDYCMEREDQLICPIDIAIHKDYNWHVARDIKAG